MKKLLLITFLLSIGLNVSAQQVYKATSTYIKFFSSAPLEDIEAENRKSSSLIDTKKKAMAVAVPIKQFQFKKKLMQEHFNENYMESDKFPKGTFKGRINEDIDFSKDGTHDVTATGKFNLHGVEKDRTLKGKLTIKGNTIKLEAKFNVRLEDHDIDIPKAVFKNIAEEVEVTVINEYQPK